MTNSEEGMNAAGHVQHYTCGKAHVITICDDCEPESIQFTQVQQVVCLSATPVGIIPNNVLKFLIVVPHHFSLHTGRCHTKSLLEEAPLKSLPEQAPMKSLPEQAPLNSQLEQAPLKSQPQMVPAISEMHHSFHTPIFIVNVTFHSTCHLSLYMSTFCYYYCCCCCAAAATPTATRFAFEELLLIRPLLPWLLLPPPTPPHAATTTITTTCKMGNKGKPKTFREYKFWW
jgi:hypothetical protein